jgi:putative membrane protein
MFRLIVVWMLNALALLVVSYVIPTIHVENVRSALVAALVLAFINTLIRPLFILLTLPVTLVTLGLFLLVINGLLFWFVGSFVRGFVVEGFWTGVFGAIFYSILSWAFASLILPRRPPVQGNS